MTPEEALKILGLKVGAKRAAVEWAYRKAALKHHPDRNPGDGEAAARFQRVHQAYCVLTGKSVAPDTLESDSLTCISDALAAALNGCVSRGVDPNAVDLLVGVRTDLATRLKENQDAVKNAVKVKGQLESVKGRFKGPIAETLSGLIDFQIAHVQKQLDHSTRMILCLKRAQQKLEGCSYDSIKSTIAEYLAKQRLVTLREMNGASTAGF